MAIPYAWLLLPLLELAAAPVAAAPAAQVFWFDVPSGPIGTSLSLFSQLTGISVGGPDLPTYVTRRLRGQMSADDAIRRLLSGSGFTAERVGGTAYRIVPILPRAPPVRKIAPALPAQALPTLPAAPALDIIVTGQKRSQHLQQVPASITVVDLTGSQAGRLLAGSRDLSLSVEGLATTNLGPGRNRQFIRGVADSPFNGPSQSTVAVQLDEARITFDAPDPDLRLIDMDRVEILKGPQGPLYGSGALGGIYHLVTTKPDLASVSGSLLLSGESVARGGPGGGVEAILNLPIVTDRLAIRGVAYLARQGGWIDNIGRNRNANASRVTGARGAVRWQVDGDWMVDVSGALQDVNTLDSQYVTASKTTERRDTGIAEPTDNDFKTAAATVQGRVGGLKLLATTSYVDHGVDYTLDSTDASAAFGFAGPTRFEDNHKYTILNQEIRLSPATSSHWLAGLSYLDAHSRSSAAISGEGRSLIVESLNRRIIEFAVFGEGTLPIMDRLSATAGARLFRTVAKDEAAEQTGGGSDQISKTILSPSLSLAWTPSSHATVYLRYARSLRPGGLAPTGQTASRRFDSDELGTIDLGARTVSAGGKITLGASLFHTVWSNIQSDYLLPNGLVSTRNAGRGRIYGVEANSEWRLLDRLMLSGGATYVNARLIRTETGLELDDRRLPITPEFTGRASVQYRWPLGAWSALLSAQANYIGRARLTFDPSLDREMGNYTSVSLAALATRNRLTIGARIENLFDIQGDSFAFGNPFSIMSGSQYTPLRPRTVTLSVSRSW
jgi:outer membrane receptor protein involved in Fe transport